MLLPFYLAIKENMVFPEDDGEKGKELLPKPQHSTRNSDHCDKARKKATEGRILFIGRWQDIIVYAENSM